MRETSIAVYNQIKEEGLIGNRQFQVWDRLFKDGPLTQRETTDLCSKDLYASERSFTPRFAELERMGLIETVGERTCRITKRHVLIWDVTNRLPMKIKDEIKPTKIEIIRALAEHLRPMVEHLKQPELRISNPKWITWMERAEVLLKISEIYAKKRVIQ